MNGTLYLPGDTILITDIGNAVNSIYPGSSLVCNTTNVNSDCCRSADNTMPNGKGRGEWYFQNRTKIFNNGSYNFYRTRSAQKVHLNRRNEAIQLTAMAEDFTCGVPNDDGGPIYAATITIGEYILFESHIVDVTVYRVH